MNTVNLIGNLTRDPDMKYTQGGMAYVTCNVAVKRQFKDKSTGEYESDFINLKAFAKTAELFANSFHKGSKVAITGNLQTGRYENNQGVTVYTADVIVQSMTFIEPKSNNSNSNQTASNVPQSNGYSNNNNPFKNDSQQVDISDDDLPF